MPHVDGQQLALARVYATAMLNLAQTRGQADELLKELLDFADEIATNPQLGTLLSSPDLDSESRRKVFERLLRGRWSDLFVDSLHVLNRKDRIGLIGAVTEAYRLALEDLRGRVEVHVSTAVPLSDPLRGRLTDVATKYAGKKADLVERVDEALLGGVIMRIGDRKFDASIAAKLKHLADAMLERASREIHEGKVRLETVK
jgi:F-type H+-transporting ATPase subunit delta